MSKNYQNRLNKNLNHHKVHSHNNNKNNKIITKIIITIINQYNKYCNTNKNNILILSKKIIRKFLSKNKSNKLKNRELIKVFINDKIFSKKI